jgi:hypothetical protein
MEGQRMTGWLKSLRGYIAYLYGTLYFARSRMKEFVMIFALFFSISKLFVKLTLTVLAGIGAIGAIFVSLPKTLLFLLILSLVSYCALILVSAWKRM